MRMPDAEGALDVLETGNARIEYAPVGASALFHCARNGQPNSTSALTDLARSLAIAQDATAWNGIGVSAVRACRLHGGIYEVGDALACGHAKNGRLALGEYAEQRVSRRSVRFHARVDAPGYRARAELFHQQRPFHARTVA